MTCCSQVQFFQEIHQRRFVFNTSYEYIQEERLLYAQWVRIWGWGDEKLSIDGRPLWSIDKEGCCVWMCVPGLWHDSAQVLGSAEWLIKLLHPFIDSCDSLLRTLPWHAHGKDPIQSSEHREPVTPVTSGNFSQLVKGWLDSLSRFGNDRPSHFSSLALEALGGLAHDVLKHFLDSTKGKFEASVSSVKWIPHVLPLNRGMIYFDDCWLEICIGILL